MSRCMSGQRLYRRLGRLERCRNRDEDKNKYLPSAEPADVLGQDVVKVVNLLRHPRRRCRSRRWRLAGFQRFENNNQLSRNYEPMSETNFWVTTLKCWNEALWLDFESHVTNQIALFQHTYDIWSSSKFRKLHCQMLWGHPWSIL